MKKVYLTIASLLFINLSFGQNQPNYSDAKSEKKTVFQIVTSYGYGWLMGDVQKTGLGAQFDNPLESLGSGGVFDVGAYFNVTPTIALGLKYDRYSSSGSSSAVTLDYKTIFIGPSLYISGEDSKIGHFTSEIALGYLGNEQNVKMHYMGINRDVKLDGGTFGFFTGVAYHFKVVNRLYIGPVAKVVLGKLSSVTQTEYGKSTNVETKESLSRFDLAISAKFRI